MFDIPKVTVTMRELDRLKCIQGLIDGHLRQNVVATRLGLTTRQVRRLVRRYESHGPVGLISRLRGRASNNRLKPEAAERAFSILRSKYVDFGPTLAAEKLRELQTGVDRGVDVSAGRITLQQWLNSWLAMVRPKPVPNVSSLRGSAT